MARPPPTLYAFYHSDSEAARARAQEIADKSGGEIIVTDEAGNEVYRAKPIRRNEIIVSPKS